MARRSRPQPAEDTTKSPFKVADGMVRTGALRNSLDGYASAWRHEAAFRQVVLLAVVLIAIACGLPVGAVERALLIATALLVVVVELVNSGIEAAIDRISMERHPLAKRAKDVASAAVLTALVLLGVVWILVAGPVLLAWVSRIAR